MVDGRQENRFGVREYAACLLALFLGLAAVTIDTSHVARAQTTSIDSATETYTETYSETYSETVSNQDSSEQTLLLQFDADATDDERAAQIAAQVAALNGRVVAWLPQIRVAAVAVPLAAGQESDVSAASLAVLSVENPAVSFAETDVIVSGAYTPTDPQFHQAERSYAPRLIQAERAWDATLGSAEVVVAVVDSGIKTTHPEFAGRLLPGYDFVHDDDDPEDEHGHGTHAAGIIAAAADNGHGAAGLCPRCLLMPVKVLDKDNQGTWFNVAQGILYAVDNGADIINLSLGAPRLSHTVAAAVAYADEQGVLVVAAGGNHGSEQPFYPAAFESVLAVNATDEDDNLWPLSNTGPNVDLAAPGHVIFSTYYDLENYLGGYAFMSGTSMASPHVAGVAGLLLSVNPSLSHGELVHLLTSTTEDLGAGGYDERFGAGRLNAAAAVAAAVATVGSSEHAGSEKSPVDQPGSGPAGGQETGPATDADTQAGDEETTLDMDEQDQVAARDNARKIIFLPMIVNR